MRTCGLDGCDKPHRARGLCSSHYNAEHQPDRHRKVQMVCEACGIACESSRATGRYCSLLCRDYARWGVRASKWTPPKPPPPPPPPPMKRSCEWCGDTYLTTRPARRMCSRRCKTKAIQARRRGRLASTPGTYTWVEVTKVFLAFGRACAYCGDPVVGPPDPDHVVPLSRGGANSITNILPSCRACNSDKRDLMLDEWAADRARRNLPPVITRWSATDRRYRHLTVTQAAEAA